MKLRKILLALATAFATVAVPHSPAVAQATDSIREARVHPAQVQRGEAVFRTVCSACHTAKQFSDANFARAWGGRPVFEFYDEIRVSMPQDGPGRLTPGEYLDVVVYLLKLNGHAAGEQELPVDEGVLRRVRFRRT